MDSIARYWRDLSGHSNWEGLLHPLDEDLCRYILHYGQLAQATYDAFNSDKASRFAGNCLYPMSDFFSKVGLENGNPFKYDVTKYLYATSQTSTPRACVLNWCSREEWNNQTNWIGYVAVATNEGKEALGRRDIVIAWRGTIEASEWIENLNFDLDPAEDMFGVDSPAQVHDGFYSIYTSNKHGFTSVKNQVEEEVQRLVNKHKNEEISITVTGHSLGAALATLSALDIALNLNIPNDQPSKASCSVTAFLFASPRVGNYEFGKIFNNECTDNNLQLRALRIRNKKDSVPKLPCRLIPLGFTCMGLDQRSHSLLNWSYTHVGEELVIDTRKSEYLKSDVSMHNLEVYLHGVVVTQLNNGELDTDDVNSYRHIALLNKSMDALKDEYGIPVAWMVQENKGMVQQSNGTWKLMDHIHHDDIQEAIQKSGLVQARCINYYKPLNRCLRFLHLNKID